ncbi:MAG: MBOAT family O-acyltransferase [Bacteroidota bacterium]
MLFSSLSFLGLFLPLVWVVNLLLPAKARNVWLLLLSLWFYAWGEGAWAFLMLGSILLNYFLGLKVGPKSSRQKLWLSLAVSINLALLLLVKYAGFLLSNLNQLLLLFEDVSLLIPAVNFSLPIGISFFTFQALSYQIDLYRGKYPPQTNPLDLGLYIAFFPQLIAGPIVRYETFFPQLTERKFDWEQNIVGIKRFVIGLAKKVLIADPLALVADKIFLLPDQSLSPWLTWLAMIAYSLQIYFDFSAYSDMAIGLGKMLGFDLPENFRFPYIARSIREFWQRWHITLSTWFRDYLYIPLGGNRHHLYRNLLLVFVLCGFWHGASWNFLIWGLFHGLFLVLERTAWGRVLQKFPRFLQHIYTLLVVLFAWVWFRAEDVSQALLIYEKLFGFAANAQADNYAYFLLSYDIIWPLLLGIGFAMPLFPFVERLIERSPKALESILYLGLTLLSLLAVLTNAYHPFIYFRF